MKIVQSFWTAGKDATNYNFGWLSPLDHYLSWILSCNLLRKQYNHVGLVTDQQGYHILVEELGLPYTEVDTCLDSLVEYKSHLWALAKIKAYSIQRELFIAGYQYLMPLASELRTHTLSWRTRNFKEKTEERGKHVSIDFGIC